ncbi:MAG: DUF374 domain-containing protein [Planctomycetota bacterium]|nr:MAG: DUF374 domain-containing protein [Planctomycetota bacterium]
MARRRPVSAKVAARRGGKMRAHEGVHQDEEVPAMKRRFGTRQRLRRLPIPAWVWRSAALGSISAIKAWWSTLNYRMARYDPTADPADARFCGPAIFIFWHEYIPTPLYARPHCRLSMLLSQHQDAELLSHIASLSGLGTVRGSSYRGGSAALRELIHLGRGRNLAITPDGPRGPRRRVAPGCIFLSSRLQIPIIGFGVGYDSPWRIRKAWDQFAIPRPFSRCRAIFGPRIQVPDGIQRDEIEDYRRYVERVLEQLTTTAEQWAEGRVEIAQQENLYRCAPRGPWAVGPMSGRGLPVPEETLPSIVPFRQTG